MSLVAKVTALMPSTSACLALTLLIGGFRVVFFWFRV